MKLKLAGSALALATAVALLLMGMPTVDARIEENRPAVEKVLTSRSVHIDPAELVDLINNANFGLRIFDLRDESEFNLFHIRDAKRIVNGMLRDPVWINKLPSRTVFVLVSNGEKRAEQAFAILSAWKVPNVYILAGGVNQWVRLYGDPQKLVVSPATDCAKAECRQYVFDAALGDRHPASDPDPEENIGRDYERKVKPLGRTVRKAGGCG